MTELDLLKTILHKLAKMEGEMVKRKDISEITVQLEEQEEQIQATYDTLHELRRSVDEKHLENINSDEMLLRSILEPTEPVEL
ncbi:hypothetical protein LGQ02_17945 [Bacillus shivajii]|uniref:hypothetical protein n=1 Tax=Bacillus shivajii TaxID=1983719 RepID=UPI001CFB5119|nr:hypothetical protein [Bacillus shivajii]UCZ52668.1 hypothetical protein LGQ02_17945 [Bacillus shivajii]